LKGGDSYGKSGKETGGQKKTGSQEEKEITLTPATSRRNKKQNP